jgi:apolipoprotein N-acyltransferase
VVLPFAVLVALTFYIHRKERSPASRVAIFLTSIIIAVSSVFVYWASIFKSESSTSALVFIFIPFFALIAIAVVYVLVWLLLRLLMRKTKG